MQKAFSSALVVEGGALRGIHTAGVMDVLMRYNIYLPFVIGVSAGALNTYNYIAHQRGRSAKILLEYIRDSRYLDLKAIPNRKQSAFGFDFMFYGLQEVIPFDMETFRDGGQEFVVVATDVDNGTPVYFRKSTCSDIFKAGAASASLPLISPPVELDGLRCIDGGVTDPIPFLKAMEESEKVVVLLTRHKGFRKRTMPFAERETARRLYKNSPQMLEAALRANDHYNDSLDLLEQLEDEGRVFVIRPSKEIDISLLERNTESLGALYSEGLRDGEASLHALAEYLGITNGVLPFEQDPVLRMRKYRIGKYTDADMLTRAVTRAASKGARYTAGDAHTAHILSVRRELENMGVQVYTDPYCFSYQTNLHAEMEWNGAGQTIAIPCRPMAYTGMGGASDVQAPITFVKGPNYHFINARGKIAVVRLRAQSLCAVGAFETSLKRPEDLSLPDTFGVGAHFHSFSSLQVAKLAGARGVICIWDDDRPMPDALLPYAQQPLPIPCAWVDRDTGDQLESLLAQDGEGTLVMRFTSDVDEHKMCDTLYAVLPGIGDRGESVIVNTHTDGLNAIDENGFTALLALIRALRDKPMQRTHIFVFSSGRLRLPIMNSSMSDSSGSIRKWLSMHGDFWDGKVGHLKAVAALSAEHLGYSAVPEIVFASNAALETVYSRAIEPREDLRAIVCRSGSGIFGEGQPLYAAGIPVLAFAAEDLAVYETDTTAESFDAAYAMDQLQTMLDCLTMLDEMPRESIGRCEKRTSLSSVLSIRASKGNASDREKGETE